MATNEDRAFATFGLSTVLSMTPMGPWGWITGQLIGARLFPQEYENSYQKPDPYNRLLVNTAMSGGAVAYAFGVTSVPGNYIWAGKLKSKAITSSTTVGGGGPKGSGGGSSQTQKTITGYKYYMNASIGICMGPIFISRMYKNNQYVPFLDSSTISVYYGTRDQTIDPKLDKKLTAPSALRDLAYSVFDDYYIGENQQSAPIWTHEVINFPYHSNAGSCAQVYEPYADAVNVSGGEIGYAAKGADGRVYAASIKGGGSDALKIKIFKKNMTLQKTITINAVSGSTTKILGVDLIERNGRRYFYVLVSESSGATASVLRVRTNRLTQRKGWFGEEITTDYDYSKEQVGAGAVKAGAIKHNDSYIYVALRRTTSTYEVKRYQWGGNCSDAPTTYDISADMNNDTTTSMGLDVTNSFAFVSSALRLVSFDLGFTAIDSLAFSLLVPPDGYSLISPPASDEVIMVRTASASSFLRVYGYDDDGDNLAFRDEKEITDFWGTSPGSGLGPSHIHWGMDGTILVAFRHNGIPYYHATAHIVVSANPAQIMYDIAVTRMDADPARLNLASLQDVCDYCLDNNIGIGGAIFNQEGVDQLLLKIMGHIYGAVYPDNDGKIAFKVFRNSDTSSGTITDAKLVAQIQSDSGRDNEDYGKVRIVMKDKRLCANRLRISYMDRLNKYKRTALEIDHYLAQEDDGEVITQNIDYPFFGTAKAASRAGWRLVKFAQYDTKLFMFDLDLEFLSLQPGAVLVLDVPSEKLDNVKVRVIRVGEPRLSSGGAVSVVARAEQDAFNEFEDYNVEEADPDDTESDSPVIVRPIIWEEAAIKNDGVDTLALTALRCSEDVIGCVIYYRSSESSTWQTAGTLHNLATTGDIAAAVGEGDRDLTVNVDNYPDPFAAVTVDEQREDSSYCLVGELQDDDAALSNLEFVTYCEVEDSGGDDVLGNCERGKDYTLPADHTTDELVVFVGFGVNGNYIKLRYPRQWLGKKVYIKAQAINLDGVSEDFDDVEEYEYDIQGYTSKATHVSGLEIREGGVGRGSAETTQNNDAVIQWKEANRVGGSNRAAAGQINVDYFIEGDVTHYDILAYNSSKVLIATHEYEVTAGTEQYTYTQAQNTTDFGGFTKDIYLGVRARNEYGYVPYVPKIHVVINT